MCVSTCVFLLVKLPSSDTYRERVLTRSRSLSFDSRLSLIRELETRTERVYHEVNGNPGVSTPGGRQITKLAVMGFLEIGHLMSVRTDITKMSVITDIKQ